MTRGKGELARAKGRLARGKARLAPGEARLTHAKLRFAHAETSASTRQRGLAPAQGPAARGHGAARIGARFRSHGHVRFYPQAGKAPESLFRTTPPTALIFEVAEGAVPAFAFLAGRGLSVPRDVSLVCAFPDGALQWYDLPLAHLRTDGSHIVRRIVR